MVRRAVFVLALLISVAAQGQTKRILVTGDSWAALSDGNWGTQFLLNGYPQYSRSQSGVSGMTASLMTTDTFLLQQIVAPLINNPSIDMVHLSIGGNDLLGAWRTSTSPQDAIALWQQIQSNVQTVVNTALSIRPNLQVTIVGYDYTNFVDTLGNAANLAVWLALGSPTPGQLNRAFFGDGAAGGSLLGMEDYKEDIARANSRVHYYNIEGAMQRDYYGGLSNIDFPSPKQRMGSNGSDAIHVNSRGWDILIDTGFNNIYNNLFAGPSLATNPANGGTLSFGHVLVGQSASVTATAMNTGGVGSRLEATFGIASGEFSGGSSALRYGFVSQYTGGDVLGQTYVYTPTARGGDSQSLAIATNAGNRSFTLQGDGVAPVRSLSASDAPLTRIGATSSASIVTTNVGDGNLSGLGGISDLRGTVQSPTGNAAFTGNQVALQLADGASTTTHVAFSPTARGSASADVAITFDNGSVDGTNAAHTAHVTVHGIGVGPTFGFSSSPIDFGSVALGSGASLARTISNLSTDSNGGNLSLTNLTLLSASISGADSAMFSLGTFTPGIVLGQGGLTNLDLHFNPTGSAGNKSATLTFVTDQGTSFGSVGQSFSFSLSGLAVGSPVIAAAMPDPKQVATITSTGQGSILAGPPALVTPMTLTHDSAGNRYVADAFAGRVVKITPGGATSVYAGVAEGLVLPTSVAMDSSGRLLVANYTTSQVLRIDGPGQSTLLGSAAGGLEGPIAIAVHPTTGLVYAAEPQSSRVIRLDGAGHAQVVASASEGLWTPMALAFDATGNLFVADSFSQRVLKINGTGQVSVFANIQDGLNLPTGLALDTSGNVYVADYTTSRILKFDSTGALSEVLAGPSAGLSLPFGLDLTYEAPQGLGGTFASSLRWASLGNDAAVPEASSVVLLAAAIVASTLVTRSRSIKGTAEAGR